MIYVCACVQKMKRGDITPLRPSTSALCLHIRSQAGSLDSSLARSRGGDEGGDGSLDSSAVTSAAERATPPSAAERATTCDKARGSISSANLKCMHVRVVCTRRYLRCRPGVVRLLRGGDDVPRTLLLIVGRGRIEYADEMARVDLREAVLQPEPTCGGRGVERRRRRGRRVAQKLPAQRA